MKKGSLLVLFLTVFIDLLGFGILLPLLPIYGKHFAEQYSLTPAQTGWVVGLLVQVAHDDDRAERGFRTAQDLLEQLANVELGRILLVPDVMLREGEDVFLDDVRIPKGSLVGGEKNLNRGWKLITGQLNHERVTICSSGIIERRSWEWSMVTGLDATMVPVNIGGVLVRPGDLVVADGDTGMQTGYQSMGHTVGFEIFDTIDVDEEVAAVVLGRKGSGRVGHRSVERAADDGAGLVRRMPRHEHRVGERRDVESAVVGEAEVVVEAFG